MNVLRAAIAILWTSALLAQSDFGELRLRIADATGLPVPSDIELVSQANQVRRKLQAGADGTVVVIRLPFGKYRLSVEHAGFAPMMELIDKRSALPQERRIT